MQKQQCNSSARVSVLKSKKLMLSHSRSITAHAVLFSAVTMARVPKPPGKSWIFSWNFQDLESPGKWAWSGKSQNLPVVQLNQHAFYVWNTMCE